MKTSEFTVHQCKLEADQALNSKVFPQTRDPLCTENKFHFGKEDLSIRQGLQIKISMCSLVILQGMKSTCFLAAATFLEDYLSMLCF